MLTQPKLTRPKSIPDLASRLAQLGYFPVPIPKGSKGPTLPGWDKLRLTPEDAPQYFTESEMLVGCLHVNLACFDIDVYDPDLAEEIIAEGFRRFPGALERIGAAPKSAIVLRLDEPGFKIHNTEKLGRTTADGEVIEAQVEVRTLTRQMVVYGKHPNTGQPYRWPRGELWATPIADLPPLTREAAQAFRDWCNERIRQWAGIAEKSAQVFDLGDFRSAKDDRPGEAEFIEALHHVPASLGHESGWRETLMAIHDFFGGSARGLDVAKDWSSADPRYTPQEVETKWRSFEVGKGVGYRSVFHHARQHGLNLSDLARKHRPKAEAVRAQDPTATQAIQQQAAQTEDAQWPTLYDFFDEAALAPRQWIYGKHYLRRFVSVLASAGGIGKTSMQIVEALAICTGRPLLGEDVREKCNVWLINLEDPMDEMQRRILAAMRYYGVAPDEVRGRLFVDAGRDFALTFAVQTREGVTPNVALVDHLIKRIPELQIGAVFIDPFVGAHQINENDNMAVNAVVGQIRKVADETNCAIGLVHHIRKGNGEDATIDSVRGAGSLIGAARAARVINKVSEQDALNLGVDRKDAIGLFRVDDGKANLAPPASAAVFRRMEGVQIANGEWVGVAIPFDLPDEWEGLSEDAANDILSIIGRGIPDAEGNEEYYSARPQDKERWAGTVITTYAFDDPSHAKNAAQAKRILTAWMKSGLIEEQTYHSAKQRKDRKGVFVKGRVGEQK